MADLKLSISFLSLTCSTVSAHAKPIASMDICKETGLLLTTSEDTFVRVWMIKPDNDSYVRAFLRSHRPNTLTRFYSFFLD